MNTMVNQQCKTVGSRKDHEPDAPPIVHGSLERLLNIQLEMQQQQMTLFQRILAAQQQIKLQQQQLQQARPSNYFLGLKDAHAPTFAGSTDPLEAKKWITEMEKLCQALCIPKDEWVNVTIPFLIGDAEAWFISVRSGYESGGRKIDWAQFQDIFYLNYFPITFRIQKENEFVNLKQGSMTVIQYSLMFNQLGCFAQALLLQERNKVTRFKKGLNLNLRECMGTAQATTYQEVLEQAIQAERLVTERNQISDGKRPIPWSEQDEEIESPANKKDTSANKKAIREDLDDNEISAQNSLLPAASKEQRSVDEKETRLAEEQKKQIETLHKRIIQLEKDLDKKQSLQVDVEHLQRQLNITKHLHIEVQKEAKKLQKMLIEKGAELEHEKKQQEALSKRIIQLEKDLVKKQSLESDIERLQGQLNIMKESNIELLKEQEGLSKKRKMKQEELQKSTDNDDGDYIEFLKENVGGLSKKIKKEQGELKKSCSLVRVP